MRPRRPARADPRADRDEVDRDAVPTCVRCSSAAVVMSPRPRLSAISRRCLFRAHAATARGYELRRRDRIAGPVLERSSPSIDDNGQPVVVTPHPRRGRRRARDRCAKLARGCSAPSRRRPRRDILARARDAGTSRVVRRFAELVARDSARTHERRGLRPTFARAPSESLMVGERAEVARPGSRRASASRRASSFLDAGDGKPHRPWAAATSRGCRRNDIEEVIASGGETIDEIDRLCDFSAA